MEFHWEDGEVTPITLMQKIVGVKRKGKRPVAIGLSLEDEQKLKDSAEALHWFNRSVVPAVAPRKKV